MYVRDGIDEGSDKYFGNDKDVYEAMGSVIGL